MDYDDFGGDEGGHGGMFPGQMGFDEQQQGMDVDMPGGGGGLPMMPLRGMGMIPPGMMPGMPGMMLPPPMMMGPRGPLPPNFAGMAMAGMAAGGMAAGAGTVMPPPPGKSLFWKTRMCKNFRAGVCKSGADCNFAHGEHELRRLPPDVAQQAKQQLEASKAEKNAAAAAAAAASAGTATAGGSGFGGAGAGPAAAAAAGAAGGAAAEGDDDGAMSPSAAAAAAAAGDSAWEVPASTSMDVKRHGKQQQQQQKAQDAGKGGGSEKSDAEKQAAREKYYKTKLCQKFVTTGFCPYGPACCYAHGEADLRQLPPRNAASQAPQHPQQQQQQQQAPPVVLPPPVLAKLPGVPDAAQPPTVGQPAAAAPPTADAPADSAQQQQQQQQQHERPPTYRDQVRALCAAMSIGRVSAAEIRPGARQAAALAIRTGQAYRGNAYADGMEMFMRV